MVVLQETRTCYFYIGTLDNVVLLQKKSVSQFKHVSIGGHFF